MKARFDAREQQRNKRRSPYDRSYFMIAACMVQLTPKAGLDLLHSESGTPEETRARRLLIGRGTACVGGAKDVEVDPAQFRAYVAESVYSWIVAAKNKSSLIS
ncbi:hypothetical protein [Novosphingobium sp. 9]|uniref:hypothetical protein n=1 Tax=Novosphingobium sp. 9 TaxID=2025349 RepID=UPI0021B62A7D|nr:hypothetical protein [Novosphingobium sp. 9]